MRTRTGVIASTLVILASLSIVSAEVIPGRWEKVDSLTSGTGIIVRMDGGERIQGRFLSSDSESINIRTFEDEERDLPKVGVKKIQTIEKTGKNKIWDGALWGAAIGAAAVGIPVAAANVDDKSGTAGAILLGAGIGAGIGLGIDAAVGARETLYVAP